MDLPPDPLRELEETMRELNDYMHERHRSAFGRYPLLFSLLGAFGVVATLYGFEQTLDDIALFREMPWIPLGIGIAVLVFTGTLYRKIDRKFE